MEFLKRAYRFLSSLGLGVTLLFLIAVILAVATKFESSTSTHLVQVFVYRTGWFDALLALFGINLSLATWNLRPWRPRHLGVITIHSSLLLILLGAWITRNHGFEGTMVIEEGQSADRITLPDMVLTVYDPERPREAELVLPTWFKDSPPREHMNERFALPGDARLVADRFYTDARPLSRVEDDGRHEDPAIHFVFRSSMFSEEGWLFLRRPGENRRSFGGLLQFEGGEAASREEWLASLTSGDPGAFRFRFAGRAWDLPLGGPGQDFELSGGHRLTVERIYRAFSIGEQGRFVDQPGPAANPALEFTIAKGDAADRYIFFAKMPEFRQLLGERALLEAVTEMDWTPRFGDGDLSEKQVRFGLLPDGLYAAWLFEGQLSEQPVEIGGAALTLPWMGFQLGVDKLFQRAWRVEDMENVDVKGHNPAVRLRSVGHNGLVDQKWLRLGQRKSFAVGDRHWLIGFEQLSVPLGFALHLDDFVEDRYPGSMMASGYASFVTMQDPDDPRDGEKIEISMNNTLVHGGFKFFQSSFQRAPDGNGPETTVLSVNHDPGHLVVYVGSLFLVLGLIVVFFFKKRLIALERR
jgi:hypothetical protein